MSPTVAERAAIPNYGIDADRLLSSDSLVAAVRRRVDGRYAVDEFGGDPHLQDLLLNPLVGRIRVEVRHGDRLPRLGPALLVANRSLGFAEPFVLTAAVHQRTRRRLRIVGVPDIPLVSTLTHKLGGIGSRAADVAAVLRAGHLTAAPLAPSWWGVCAREVPRELLAATMGFPVFPVAIRAGGPIGLWLRPWVVSVGEPLSPPAGTSLGDPLVAAELSEAVQHSISELLEVSRS
jgi:1-acyl-sn-glycerol-3-phosphate acyltransferase